MAGDRIHRNGHPLVEPLHQFCWTELLRYLREIASVTEQNGDRLLAAGEASVLDQLCALVPKLLCHSWRGGLTEKSPYLLLMMLADRSPPHDAGAAKQHQSSKGHCDADPKAIHNKQDHCTE